MRRIQLATYYRKILGNWKILMNENLKKKWKRMKLMGNNREKKGNFEEKYNILWPEQSSRANCKREWERRGEEPGKGGSKDTNKRTPALLSFGDAFVIDYSLYKIATLHQLPPDYSLIDICLLCRSVRLRLFFKVFIFIILWDFLDYFDLIK